MQRKRPREGGGSDGGDRATAQDCVSPRSWGRGLTPAAPQSHREDPACGTLISVVSCSSLGRLSPVLNIPDHSRTPSHSELPGRMPLPRAWLPRGPQRKASA